MVARVLITIQILVLLWLINLLLARSFVVQYHTALPGCPQSCGSVQMYYPFGFGKNCFFDKWFEIDCRVDNRSTHHGGKKSYTPYIKSIGLEVKYFDESNSLLAFLLMNSSYDLRGTPFSFSRSENAFAGIGCDIVAYSSNRDYDVGPWCASVCDPADTDYPKNLLTGCVVELKQNIHMLEPVILSTIDRKNASGFGFLAYRNWLGDQEYYRGYQGYASSTSHFENIGTVKKTYVQLDWEFYNARWDSFRVDNVTASCKTTVQWVQVNNSFYSNSSFKCTCRWGYEGNPYLRNGCRPYSAWDDAEDKKKSNWKLVVIGVCSAVGALILVLFVWLLYKVVKKDINRRKKEKYFKQNGGLLLEQISSSDGNIEKTKVFSSYELEKATNNFNVDRVLGQGGQGTVYKGMLSDGRIVAIKKSILVATTNIGQFINEVVILSQINHRNIVKLLGCCLETEVPLLVYEFILKGTLFQHIHNPNEDFPLTWETRLRIGAEIAGALSYMHYAASKPIYHRDIKSTNILLDEKYKAIVSDFGTSRSVDVDKTHFTTLVQGTFGYLDPEYFRSSQLTEKSDVYCFGVVLVELLTSQKPILSNTSQEVKGLASHFIELMEQNQLLEIIDPEIVEESKMKEIFVVAQLAKMCLDMNGKRRPTMKEVAMQLQSIRMSPEKNITDGNNDVIGNNEFNLAESFDASSTSTGTWCKGTMASSLDEPPFLTYP